MSADEIRLPAVASAPEVHIRPLAYEVSLWPEGTSSINASSFTLTVMHRGPNQWAVLNGGTGSRRCLGSDGLLDWDTVPPEHADEWLATHRFTREEAFALAREHAPKVTLSGVTAAEVLAEESGDGTAPGGAR